VLCNLHYSHLDLRNILNHCETASFLRWCFFVRPHRCVTEAVVVCCYFLVPTARFGPALGCPSQSSPALCSILSSHVRFSACANSCAAPGVLPVFCFCFPIRSLSPYLVLALTAVHRSVLPASLFQSAACSVSHGQESGLLPPTFSRDQVLARAVLAHRIRRLVLLVFLILVTVFQISVVCESLQGEAGIALESPD
jgi:hypothetical protein